MNQSIRTLTVTTETLGALQERQLRVGGAYDIDTGNCRGGANMFPYSNAYATRCLVGTGCGSLSSGCA